MDGRVLPGPAMPDQPPTPPNRTCKVPLGAEFVGVLQAAQAGAGWAFTRLYEDLGGVVTGYLRLQGAHEPDDVASETFLAVFRNLPPFSGEEEQFRSWVFTIAHRRLLDERRRRSRRPSTVELDHRVHEPAVAGPELDVLDRVEAEGIRPLLDRLTDGQRDVLLLRIIAGMTIAETASALGRRGGAVKQLQRRGLLRIQEEISESVVTP